MSGLVQNKIEANITSGVIFIFLNKRRTMMKLLKVGKRSYCFFCETI
ncbi:IS66 family insertion sequence element accessory protein TnpB [Halosquirtibacter laminarini]|uniref:IS66 family insertion sequence element accessory protein TnpB n=1 Tax=Halosquirtibacter laminarini TaxID=3374600 RepID=A0AC61NK51_9BACT|nr:IS66 family insertion sequence element accessory protein TnpB [Prolixibacteraceae bacterium]